jgi:hypothetical protein
VVVGTKRFLGLVGLSLLSMAPVARGQSNGGYVPAPSMGWGGQQQRYWDGNVWRVQAPAQPAAPGAAQPATPGVAQPLAPGAVQPGAPVPVAPSGVNQPPPTPPPVPPGNEPMANAAAAENLASEVETASLNEFGVEPTPIMLGDMAPFSTRVFLANPPTPNPGQPPLPPTPRINHNGATAAVPWVRGFKMADNMSPRPQDRVYFTFNYFNDLNGAVNQRLGNQVSNLQAYRYIFGFEKTFLEGNASLGIRMPIDTLTSSSRISSLQGTHTSVGELTMYGKYVLWQDTQSGSLISTGMAVTVPNSPSSFAGSPAQVGFHDTQLQPFIGYIFRKGKFYLQGFESIDVPTLSRDVTMFYSDIGIGYFVWENRERNAFLTGIAPTFETHVNNPLNHRGAFRINDVAGTPDVVDFTLAANFIFGRQGVFTVGFVDPVTGPKPFDFEVMALLNIFFGRTRNATPQLLTPPVAGG